MDTWYVIGAGYTGKRLVDRLAREKRDEVLLTRRRKEDAEALSLPYGSLLVGGFALDLAKPETVPDFGDSIVVCLAPPGDDPQREIENLVAKANDAKRLIYISSTGVYGAGDGAWVDESWPIGAGSSSAQLTGPLTSVAAARTIASTKSSTWMRLTCTVPSPTMR